MTDKYHQVYTEYKQRAEARIAQLEAERDAAYNCVRYLVDRKTVLGLEEDEANFRAVVETARKLAG